MAREAREKTFKPTITRDISRQAVVSVIEQRRKIILNQTQVRITDQEYDTFLVSHNINVDSIANWKEDRFDELIKKLDVIVDAGVQGYEKSY